jgi:hypothetical protein
MNIVDSAAADPPAATATSQEALFDLGGDAA